MKISIKNGNGGSAPKNFVHVRFTDKSKGVTRFVMEKGMEVLLCKLGAATAV